LLQAACSRFEAAARADAGRSEPGSASELPPARRAASQPGMASALHRLADRKRFYRVTAAHDGTRASAQLNSGEDRANPATAPSQQPRLSDDSAACRPASPVAREVTAVAASGVTVETADAKVSSDSTVRQSPSRRRTNDHRRGHGGTTGTCPLHRSHQLRLIDREARRPLATAEPYGRLSWLGPA
jgi:hypothetical protein